MFQMAMYYNANGYLNRKYLKEDNMLYIRRIENIKKKHNLILGRTYQQQNEIPKSQNIRELSFDKKNEINRHMRQLQKISERKANIALNDSNIKPLICRNKKKMRQLEEKSLNYQNFLYNERLCKVKNSFSTRNMFHLPKI